jgi:2-keto-3-deoxy-6-phosphogluconate aldolase
MVSIPGVFTPTDAANTYRYGADFAKLFPNSEVNISYLKALTIPLDKPSQESHFNPIRSPLLKFSQKL